MNKIQSVNLLRGLGFNVPELLETFLAYDSETFSAKWEDFRSSLQEAFPKLSIRTSKGDESKCPHYPNISWNESKTLTEKLLEEGYEVYLFEGIDPANCLRRGNFIAFSSYDIEPGKVFIEYLEGPGTVRDLEGSDKTISLVISAPGTVPEKFTGLALAYFDHPQLLGKILEWSEYKIPVGVHKQALICWEVRPWK